MFSAGFALFWCFLEAVVHVVVVLVDARAHEFTVAEAAAAGAVGQFLTFIDALAVLRCDAGTSCGNTAFRADFCWAFA